MSFQVNVLSHPAGSNGQYLVTPLSVDNILGYQDFLNWRIYSHFFHMPLSHFVSAGVDVSKETLDVALLTSDGEVSQQVFKNHEEGLKNLLTWLVDHQVPSEIPIVIESTGSLHWLACLMLVEHGYSVRLINPIITKKYQQSSIRDSKTDSIDASRLAEIGRLEKDLPGFFDTREQLSRKRYQSLLAKLLKTRQQVQRAYDDAIEASTVIGVKLELDCVKTCIDQLASAINALKRIMTKQATPLAKEISEVAGVSLFQATVLCTAVEGKHFNNRDQLVAFFGLDVRQRQSGTWKGRQKLSKRGNPFYRLVLFQLGWSLQRNNPDYHAYYERVFREHEKHYYTAILATARKFLRFFFLKMQNHS